jgi:hypothetical protein
MEQVCSPVPEKAGRISPVQVLAFVFGVVSLLVSLITAAIVLWSFVTSLIDHSLSISLPMIPFIVAILCGIAAIVLGVIGLALDRKTRQRTAGLVFSVLGLWFGAAAAVFLICAAFWTGLFSTLLRLIAV